MDTAQTAQNPAAKQAIQTVFGSQIPKGPDFIDSAACRCSLRKVPESVQGANGNEVAWRCIGDQTEAPYEGVSGKWFYPQNKGREEEQQQPEASARNPPDLSTAYVVVDGGARRGSAFQEQGSVDDPELSELDAPCDGRNNTLATTFYYQEIARLRAGLPPQLCADPNAVPVILQNETSWNQTGCLEGFHCV